jgi:putative transcriptional regulator
MIKIELEKLLGERSLYSLSQETGIRWGTIAAIAKGTIRRIDLESLDVLCNALKCQPGDLLTRVERKTRKKGK